MNWVEIILLHELEVPYMNLLIRVRSNQQGVSARHLMNWLAHIRASNLIELAILLDLPKFDKSIPTSRDNDAITLNVERVDILHRSIVLTNSLRLHLLLVRVPIFNSVVRTCYVNW
jgi:hypothetical protein